MSISVVSRVNNAASLDFQLLDRNPPSLCGTISAACPDSLVECENNVEEISHAQTDDYNVIQFRRPLAASDNCDVPIILGVTVST